MKNSNVHSLFKAIALIFTFQTNTLKPITMPSCLQQFNTRSGKKYIQNCKQINQYVKKFGILYFACTNTEHKTDKINVIQKQLAAFETELYAAEQQALLAIKEKYQVSNTIWQKFLADLHRMKAICTKNMKKAHPEAVHDTNIPATILEILITLLKQNDINPYSINLKMVSDQDEIDNNPNYLAQASNYVASFKSIKEPTLSYSYKPSTIELFPIFIKEKLITNIISTCAHEIQHIVQHHHLTCILLAWYLKRYYNIDPVDLHKTEEHHTLTQIHEAQAEILSAITDPKIANCLKIKRKTMYYPDRLYEEHFFQLAYIDMLWKTHTLLNNFNNRSSIDFFK